MFCWLCPLMGVLGGAIGSRLGINPPPTRKGRMISATITISLVVITTIALKIIFNISLCYPGGWFTAKNLILIPIKTACMGTIYAIGVNYLLQKYVYIDVSKNKINSEQDPSQNQQQENNQKECCCNKT